VRSAFLSSRAGYVTLALATILIGLVVHLQVVPLGPAVRDIVGDALWAAMILWWISALTPRAPLWTRSLAAFGVCVAVELSQLIHTPALETMRETRFGHLVLGSGFDPRDFVAYVAGVIIAAGISTAWSGASRN
jgi:hypothetical protein